AVAARVERRGAGEHHAAGGDDVQRAASLAASAAGEVTGAAVRAGTPAMEASGERQLRLALRSTLPWRAIMVAVSAVATGVAESAAAATTGAVAVVLAPGRTAGARSLRAGTAPADVDL